MRETDRETDLVADDKGTDEDETYGCEKDDGGEEADGFEHLNGKGETSTRQGWQEIRNYQF